MKYYRKRAVKRIFSIILAIVVFNLSIDPPDMLKNMDSDISLEEDLSVNEMESIAEVILEKGFDIDNAVPETDDPESDNMIKKAEIIIGETQYTILQINYFLVIRPFVAYRFPYFSNPNTVIFSPPPEGLNS